MKRRLNIEPLPAETLTAERPSLWIEHGPLMERTMREVPLRTRYTNLYERIGEPLSANATQTERSTLRTQMTFSGETGSVPRRWRRARHIVYEARPRPVRKRIDTQRIVERPPEVRRVLRKQPRYVPTPRMDRNYVWEIPLISGWFR